MNSIDVRHNWCSLAYGLAAAYYTNPHDSHGNVAKGIHCQDSFSKKLKATMTRKKTTAAAYSGACFITDIDTLQAVTVKRSQPGPVDDNTVYFPQSITMSIGDRWSYDLDDAFITLLENYKIYLLQGPIGLDGHEVNAVIGCIAIPQTAGLPVEIAFKGTQGGIGLASVINAFLKRSTPEWNTNLYYDTEDFFNFGGAHRGMAKVARKVLRDIYLILIGNRMQSRKINVTGHSLGAGLASLSALGLMSPEYLITHDITLYAFASPCVGDLTLVGNINRLFPGERLQSVHFAKDPVRKKIKNLTHYNSVDLSAYVSQKGLRSSSDLHYLTTLHYAQYKQHGVPISIRPLITCCDSHDLRGRPVVAIKDGFPIAITGHTPSFVRSSSTHLVPLTRSGSSSPDSGHLVPFTGSGSSSPDSGIIYASSPIDLFNQTPSPPVMMTRVSSPPVMMGIPPVSSELYPLDIV